MTPPITGPDRSEISLLALHGTHPEIIRRSDMPMRRSGHCLAREERAPLEAGTVAQLPGNVAMWAGRAAYIELAGEGPGVPAAVPRRKTVA